MEQPGVVGPNTYPIRHPTDPKKNNGRIDNPPRYMEDMGGMTGAAKWEATGKHANGYRVEKPTNVKVAHDTSERKV